jgi:prepilin-type N-terminal cleavage/methylation domain-containing protein
MQKSARIAGRESSVIRLPGQTPRGYTLIEVVVAIVLFSVGALALGASSAFVARAMGRNAVRETAARAAANKIEIIKSKCPKASIMCSTDAP